MRYLPGEPHQLPVQRTSLAANKSRHFGYEASNGIATITLNRPERKNPLTFESYAELRDLFRLLGEATDIKAVVLTGAGENFCSGGDVHEIIGPLTKLDMPGLLTFTRLTGDLVKAIRACPQPVIAAIDGACAGAGALLALASDLRMGTSRTKIAFLFTRVGLAGCDMGACTLTARHWPGPRSRATFYRTQHKRGRSRALGISQSPVRTARAVAGSAESGSGARQRTDGSRMA